MSKIRTKRSIFALLLMIILVFNLFSASAMAVDIENEEEKSVAAGVFPEFPATIVGTYVYWSLDPTIYASYSSWEITATCVSGTSAFDVIIDVFYNPGYSNVGYTVTKAKLYPTAI